jgi:hypothetical protein
MFSSCRTVFAFLALTCSLISSGGALHAQTAANPSIAFITPLSTPAGGAGITLTITGSNFGFTTTAYWDRQPLATSFLNSNQISATVPAALLAAAGQFPISVVNTNGVGSGTVLFTVTGPAITITTAALPSAAIQTSYSQSLTASGGTAPYTWAAVNTLPPGLTLTQTGQLTGSPTSAGSFSFTVRVTDAGQQTATKLLSLNVQATSLAITTVSPLFSGTVGSAYSQTLLGSGGKPPYSWTMRSNIPGLTLDRATGVLSGMPEQAGASTINVQLSDSAGAAVSKDLTLTIEQPQLRITNGSPLPAATVGTRYEQRFIAAGGRAPYTWTLASGSVPGLVLDPATGILAEAPTASGTFTFTIGVRDSGGITASKDYTISVGAGPLSVQPVSDVLRSSAGASFDVSMSASGGTLPYTWSANGLPEGLSIDPASGRISGTPRVPGSFLFTVRVTDAVRTNATELFEMEVAAPSLPAMEVPGLSEIGKPADQPSFGFRLAAPYDLPITGQLMLNFAPEAGAGDPAVQFSTGGRTVNFRIPAGSTEAEFSTPSIGLQTGTVAGTISLLALLRTENAALTATPVAVHSIRIDRTAPVVTSTSYTRTSTGIEIKVTGYSNSREVTQATFRFRAAPGNSLTTSDITVPLEEPFGRWFRDPEAAPYGGQFTFTQQFTIQGDPNAVTPVSVALTNRSGTTSADIR